MSQGIRPFTPTTAPRQGGKPGRKAKLSAQALEILNRLLVDWTKHGAETLRVLRVEQPAQYARLAIETAAKLSVAAETTTVIDDVPTVLVVRWGTPNGPAPPPPPPHTLPEVSPFTPPPAPRLLTFAPPD